MGRGVKRVIRGRERQRKGERREVEAGHGHVERSRGLGDVYKRQPLWLATTY